MKFKDRSDINIFDEGVFESCFIEIVTKPKNIIIGEIYRIPGTNEIDFMIKYEKIISTVKAESKNLIIGTDQNLDYLKVHTHSNTAKFLDLNLSNDLLPTITKPTRITHRTCTLIDNIYIPSSLTNNLVSCILATDISDHLPCLTILNGAGTQIREPINLGFRKLDDHNINRIKNAIKQVDWNRLQYLNANQGYDHLIEKITSIMDVVAPVKYKKIKPQNIAKEPWMSAGLMQSSRKCDKLYKKVCGLDRDDPKFREYKLYRNTYNKLKRKSKVNYYMGQIEKFRRNSKNLWKTLKDIIGKSNDKTCISDSFTIDGKAISDPNVISNGFCSFYSTMGKKLANKIRPPDKHFTEYMPEPCDASIFLKPTSYKEIFTIISKMKAKTSTGYDGISNKLLKSTVSEISLPLTIIFNKSLKEGLYPDSMKTAKVIPLYKSKDSTLSVNYRPVSLLPVISKVLEKVVHKRLYSFLTKKTFII